MFLDPIQDSLELHPVVRLREVVCVGTAILSKSTRDASSIVAPRARVEADGSVDAENAPTDPCKTTERFCTSSHTHHQRFPFRRTQDRNPQTQWGQLPTDSAEEPLLWLRLSDRVCTPPETPLDRLAVGRSAVWRRDLPRTGSRCPAPRTECQHAEAAASPIRDR
jgi:hypothetical protein